MKTLLTYFWRGLLFIVPLAIIIYVILQIFLQIGSLFHEIGLRIHPLIDPIIGLLALVLLILLFGILGSSILFRPLFSGVESLIERAPLIKTVYFAIRDVLSAFVGTRRRFTQPVLVKINKEAELERLGFVTCDDLTEVGITKNKVAVYFPFSYTISGNLYIVPRENITPLNAGAADIMKFIVSGGIIEPDKETNVKNESTPPKT